MTPFQIFLIPGEYALALICQFFSVLSGEMQPELYLVYSTMLAAVIWAWCINLCVLLIKRAFGFHGPRGRG